jgi:cytochrome c oxidase subunit 4
VFFALAVLTVVTVWAAHLHVSPAMHVGIAMTIATIKGGLVVAFFMHLITEKRLISALLYLTGFLFLCLLLITLFTSENITPSVPVFFK